MWKVLPGLDEAPTSVEFGPGQVVAVASWDSKVTLVDCAAGRVRTSLELRAPALSMAWGKTNLYMGGAEQHLTVLDASTGKTWDFGGDHFSAISAVCAAPNGSVLSAGFDGNLQVADARSDQGVFYPLGTPSAPAKIASMDISDNLLVVGMMPRQAAVFDIRRLSVPITTKELQIRQPLRRVAISGDTYAVSSVQSRVTVDNVKHDRGDFAFRCHRTQQHGHSVNALLFSPNGTLLTGGADRAVHLWSVNNQQHLAELPRLPEPVQDLSISSDGQLLAATCCDDSYTRTAGAVVRTGQLLVHDLD